MKQDLTSSGAEVTAPAKLTLSLRVTGVRPDGYHLLDAEMVAIDLADTLCFADGDGLEVVDAGASAGGYGEVPTDASNLVRRALALVGRQAHVRLVKRIPAGAGLGGGSADAAAVLRWAGTSRSAGLEMAMTASTRNDTTTTRRFDAGPARVVRLSSRTILRKFRVITGVGFAQPTSMPLKNVNPIKGPKITSPGNRSVPTGSTW